MGDCIFCKIIKGELPSEKVYEDDMIMCFKDLEPQAPVHVLIIPKKHIASMDELKDEDAQIIVHMNLKVKEIASALGLSNGYRVVINCGEDGLQTVPHLHMHLLGKRFMKWPPG